MLNDIVIKVYKAYLNHVQNQKQNILNEIASTFKVFLSG